MAKPKKTEPAGTPQQSPKIPVDEYHGIGGSYVIDPESGKRTRVAGPVIEADNARTEAAVETQQTETEKKADEIQ